MSKYKILLDHSTSKTQVIIMTSISKTTSQLHLITERERREANQATSPLMLTSRTLVIRTNTPFPKMENYTFKAVSVLTCLNIEYMMIWELKTLLAHSNLTMVDHSTKLLFLTVMLLIPRRSHQHLVITSTSKTQETATQSHSLMVTPQIMLIQNSQITSSSQTLEEKIKLTSLTKVESSLMVSILITKVAKIRLPSLTKVISSLMELILRTQDLETKLVSLTKVMSSQRVSI